MLEALAALVFTSAACGSGQPGAKQAEGSDFALRDMTGQIVRLSDYLGQQVVLINFWASWCAPCAAELPQLDRLYKAHKAEGFVVLGIAMDGPETVANVAPIVHRYDLSFPILLDEETRVVAMFNPKRAAPFSVLMGRDGRVAKTREGYVSGDEKSIEADVVSLLKKHA